MKRVTLFLVLLMIIPVVSAGVPNKVSDKILNQLSIDDDVPVIVFFKNEISGLKDDFLVTDIIKENQELVLNSLGNNFKNAHKFQNINAMSGKLTKKGIENLESNPEVSAVFYDDWISLDLETAVPTIGAIQTQDVLNYTGRGIVVAIIDSGIDYGHDDFGNCTAINTDVGCRVIGGYDFINGDSDPMDDNGHGTHVAGIIGANGSIKGVAPEVDFYALKACNSLGNCLSSAVVESIDWAMAHDADILSLSLGEHSLVTDGYDGISYALNDAVQRGFVAVAAAGNEGNSSGSISSPGDGVDLITVGSVDDHGTADISDDTISSFSSRGPSMFGRLDPDLVAPGSSINSTYLNEGYATLSGTSMATPMVSGAIALMLESDSSLTPSKIRSRLMHTANNVTGSLFGKGAGLINVSRAITDKVYFDFNGKDRLEIVVNSNENQTFELNINNTGNDEINLTFFNEDIYDAEDYQKLNNDVFSYYNVTLESGTNDTVKFNITLGEVNASVYGTTIVAKDQNGLEYRLPVVITVPRIRGNIYGSVDSYYLGCSGNNCGDYLTYEVLIRNQTKINMSLNWDSSSDNLGLYVVSDSGKIIDFSNDTGVSSQEIILDNISYDHFWLMVHANTLSNGKTNFNVTFDSVENISVTPNNLDKSLIINKFQCENLTIYNDDVERNLNAEVDILTDFENLSLNGTVIDTYTYPWQTTSKIKFLTANLTYSTIGDLDLYFIYNNGTNWLTTPYKTQHYNDVSGQLYETLSNIPVGYYSNKYGLVGLLIYRTGPLTYDYNLSVKTVGYDDANFVTIENPGILSSNEIKNISLCYNTSGLVSDKNYNLFLDVGAGGVSYYGNSYIFNVLSNRNPKIISFLPSTNVSVNDGDYLNMNVSGFDADGDVLYYYWYLDNNLVGVENNNTFIFNYGDVGSHNITAVISDGELNNSVYWNISVAHVNNAPSINSYSPDLNYSMNENDSMNFTINASDYENDSLSYLWFLNDTLVNENNLFYYFQTNYSSEGNYNLTLIVNDSQIINSTEWNITVNDINQLPYVTGVENYVVNESDIVNISFNVIDLDGDSIFINYSYPFNESGNWVTDYQDSGNYSILINVSDLKGDVLFYVNVTVNNIEDEDNDGINDSNDTLIGNKSSLNTNVDLNVSVNNDDNLTKEFSDVGNISFYTNETSLVNFEFNFSNRTLNLTNVTILENDESDAGGLIIRGLEHLGTKTVYIKNENQISAVCIDDSEISSFSEISPGCDDANEYLIQCNNVTSNSYRCEAIGNYYKISGLNHSGIIQECQDSDGDGYGLYCVNGDDCDDLDSSKTTSCTTSSSHGGGGSSGSSIIVTQTKNNNTYYEKSISSLNYGNNFTLNIVNDVISKIKMIPVKNYSDVNLSVSLINEDELNIPKLKNDVYQYIKIDLVDDLNSEIYFNVNKSYLINNNISLENVVLWRYHYVWQKLTTAYVSLEGDIYTFKAYTPGFSYFAVSYDDSVEIEPKVVNEQSDQVVETIDDTSLNLEPKNYTLSDELSSVNITDIEKTTSNSNITYLLLIIGIIILYLFVLMLFNNKKTYKKK